MTERILVSIDCLQKDQLYQLLKYSLQEKIEAKRLYVSIPLMEILYTPFLISYLSLMLYLLELHL